jgi:hypothetical protein
MARRLRILYPGTSSSGAIDPIGYNLRDSRSFWQLVNSCQILWNTDVKYSYIEKYLFEGILCFALFGRDNHLDHGIGRLSSVVGQVVLACYGNHERQLPRGFYSSYGLCCQSDYI